MLNTSCNSTTRYQLRFVAKSAIFYAKLRSSSHRYFTAMNPFFCTKFFHFNRFNIILIWKFYCYKVTNWFSHIWTRKLYKVASSLKSIDSHGPSMVVFHQWCRIICRAILIAMQLDWSFHHRSLLLSTETLKSIK